MRIVLAIALFILGVFISWVFSFLLAPAQGQGTWMPAPQPPPDCPPGLEYLTQINQLLIKQQVELLEGIFFKLRLHLSTRWKQFDFKRRRKWLKSYRLIDDFIFIIFFSAFTGFETNNKYKITNNLGQQVYFAAEGKDGHRSIVTSSMHCLVVHDETHNNFSL